MCHLWLIGKRAGILRTGGISIVPEGGHRGARGLCLSVRLSRNRIEGSVVGDQTVTGPGQKPFWIWEQEGSEQKGPENEKTTGDQIVSPQLYRCRDGESGGEHGRAWGCC